jgi:beta-lactam-binding protein with PASTA domain
MKKRILTSVGLACAVGAIALPVSGAYGSSYPTPKVCKVPSVTGKALSSAESAITKANCTVGTISTKASSTVAKGDVISQSPSSGSGPTVKLTVSLGKKTASSKCTVPNVVGKTEASAESALVAAGCGVGKISTAKSKTVAKGKVISESPAAGSTESFGDKISLKVSKGK